MNRYNKYMDNLRKSKKLALDLIEDTKDIILEEDEAPIKNIRLRSPSDDLELNKPSTSRTERPTEFVKYGKITFNTTAILHHYPQMNKTENHVHHTKKLNCNSDKAKTDNNNISEPDKVETKITINNIECNANNNDSIIRVNSVSNVEPLDVLKKPVKFTEEKLV
ncbi:unnamed protein product [Colias eurytheme]|nr:unnamed protein product [Colias eurytheme]